MNGPSICTLTFARRACFTIFAVPRPPGKATTRSGLPLTSIEAFRNGPAAPPWASQLALKVAVEMNLSRAQASASVSAPRALP